MPPSPLSSPIDFEIDRRGRLTHIGPGVERTLGYSSAELEGQWIGRLLHERHLSGLRMQVEMRRGLEATWQPFHFHVAHSDGNHRLVTLETRLRFDADGRFGGATGRVLRMSSDEMQADADFFGGLVTRHASDSVIVTEAEPVRAPGPRILYVNDALCRETGYTRSELVGQTPRIFQGPETDRAALDRIREALDRWEPVTEELCNYRKDGSRFWIELSITPVADAGGYFTHWVAVQRDISERKRLEAELAENQARFRELVANLPGVVYRCTYDRDWHSQYLSAQFEQICGYTLDQFEGAHAQSFKQLVHPDDLPHIRRAVQIAVQSRGSYDVEYRIRHADGSTRWVHDQGRPFFDADGAVRYLDGVFFDVTDRVRVDKRLRMLEAAVENATESILITDATERGTIEFVNPGFERMTGYTADEVIGKTPRLMQGPDTDPGVINRLRTNLRDGDDFFGETINYRKDGTPFSIEWSISEVRDPSGTLTHHVAVQRDVTARRAADQQLRLLESAVEAAPDGVVVCEVRPDLGYPVAIYANSAFFAINGHDVIPVSDIGPHFFVGPENDSDQLEQFFRLFSGTSGGTVEGPTHRKDGSVIHSEVSVAPVIGQSGSVTHWVIVQRDVTHMRRYEAEREARVRAEQMVRAKSTFFDNLSHEIRTPLTAILGAADVLASEVPPDQYEFAEMVQQGGERLLYTLDSFLDLARLESEVEDVRLAEVALLPLLETVVRAHRPTAARKGITLNAHCPTDLHTRTDASALSSALGHVIGNAVKFTDRGGITIDVSQPSDRVTISVRDTGVGIAPDFLPHVFDEFAQQSDGLDRSHEGNGLGLTIAHRLVARISGRIDVASTMGEGSTVTISLPAKVALPVQSTSTTVDSRRRTEPI